MKIKLLLILQFLLISLMSNAQENEVEQIKESQSSFVNFDSNQGSLILRQYYNLGSLKTKLGFWDILSNKEYVSLDVNILVSTDVKTKAQRGCVRLEEGTRYIGTLDYEELDACIQSIDYMKSIIMNPTQNYTECSYKTLDKLELGVYCSNGKWSSFIKYGRYVREPSFHFTTEFLLALYDYLVKAKETLPSLLD